VTSIAGDVRLLDGAGKELWARQMDSYLFAPTTVADVDGDGQPEIVAAAGSLYAFDVRGNERWRTPDYGSIARGAAVADTDGDGGLELLFGAQDRQFRMVQGSTGKPLWTFDATVRGHVYEGIDSGPLVDDFDGDGNLDVFFVAGKGTSDATRPENYGRAYALRLGPGRDAWPVFRGNLQRTGTRSPPACSGG